MGAHLVYGGFWRRLGALLLDVVFLLPLTLPVIWLQGQYRLFQFYYLLPGLGIGFFYQVYLVQRFGGTPGKLVAGLRIAKLDGSPAGYREAILRALPETLFGLLTCLAMAFASLKLTDSEFASLAFVQRSQRLMALVPFWWQPVHWLQFLWTWSEFIVLLTNERRRALHDFIAGTVVVLRNPGPNIGPLVPPPAPLGGGEPPKFEY